MTPGESFDDVADAAIEMVLRGVPSSRILKRYPQYAQALRPLLGAAEALTSSPPAPPPSKRLEHNFATLGLALPGARPQPTPARPRAWWRRRRSLASMSLPAGLAAGLLLVGAAAAAGTVSQTSGLPNGITHAITFGHVGGSTRREGGSTAPSAPLGGAKAPDQQVTPTGGAAPSPDGAAGAEDERSRTIPAGAAAALTATPERTASTPAFETAAAAALTTPGGAEASPGVGEATPDVAGASTPGVTTTLSGTIHDVHGNTFTLTSADGEWKVNVDAKTVIHGTIAEGASAIVTGDVTASKNLHAATVDIGAVDGSQTPLAAATPTPGDKHTTGPPPDHTPAGHAQTPGSRGKGG